MTASGGWSLHGLLALHARDQRLRGGGGADLGAVDAEDEGFAAPLFGGCGRDIGEPLGRAALRPAPRGGGPASEIGARIAVGLVLDRVLESPLCEIGGAVRGRGRALRFGEDGCTTRTARQRPQQNGRTTSRERECHD